MMQKLSLFVEIAERAIEVEACKDRCLTSKEALSSAHRAWKAENGKDHVERDTDDWRDIVQTTADEYQLSQLYKRQQYNAKRRLSTAIRKYRSGRGA